MRVVSSGSAECSICVTISMVVARSRTINPFFTVTPRRVTDGEIGVKRILGVLALARKHGAPTVDDAAKAAIELGAPSYRFLRRYLER